MRYFKVSRVNLFTFVTFFVIGALAIFLGEWLTMVVCVFSCLLCAKIAVYERLLDLYNDDISRKRTIIKALRQYTGWDN